MLRANPEEVISQKRESSIYYTNEELISDIIRYNFILTVVVVCSMVLCMGVVVYLVTRK